jgi:hypothetical protein
MQEFEFTFVVRADEQSKVRDLGNDVQAGIRNAQRAGRHTDVEVVQGPTIVFGDSRSVVRDLLIDADAELSHMLHRGSWARDRQYVSGLIGRLRNAYKQRPSTCTRGDHPAGTPCNGFPAPTCPGYDRWAGPAS